MKIIYQYSSLFFILLFAVSCYSVRNKNPFLGETWFDTLAFGQSRNTSTRPSSFYERFNIIIPSCYDIVDSLPVNLNGDKYIDTIIIVEPIVLDTQAIPADFNRLLVEILTKQGKGRIRKVYPNLITDVGGVLSPYNGIYKTPNGFKIVHEAGARYGWEYSVEFSTKGETLKLIEEYKKCWFDDRFLDFHKYYNDVTADKINVPDTLKKRCDCDSIWHELSHSTGDK